MGSERAVEMLNWMILFDVKCVICFLGIGLAREENDRRGYLVRVC